MSSELILMSFSIVHCQMAHMMDSCWFRHCNSRLSWFLICSRWRWSSKKRMWRKILASDDKRHSSSVFQKWGLEVGMCLKTGHFKSCIFCNQMEMIRVLLLSLTFSHDMERKVFDSLEIEANAAVGSHCTHHLSMRCCNSSQLLKRIEKEALDQIERWQNLWAFPFWYEAAYLPSHER